VGDEKGPTIDNSRTAFLSSSYAINCNTKTHGGYEAYAIFMIVVYVAILPAAMTWFRWRQHQRSASFGYYTPSFWWFDTYDLFYRLTMTGFLLVISQNSDKVRMIASTFVSIACLFYVTTVRPFLQESHNMVLTTGQAVVGMTVFCGFVLESDSVNKPLMGWFLIVMNVLIVIVEEYRAEKGEENWPHSQYLTDVLRASFIVSSAEEMVRVWESLLASSEFDVVRLKNKIGKCMEPFNLHANVLFKPEECEDPILCELQFYPRGVFDLQHRQHLAYEVRRAKGVKDLIPP
jgi:hypothetical protein